MQKYNSERDSNISHCSQLKAPMNSEQILTERVPNEQSDEEIHEKLEGHISKPFNKTKFSQDEVPWKFTERCVTT